MASSAPRATSHPNSYDAALFNVLAEVQVHPKFQPIHPRMS